jgi:hypothetical protein
MDFGREISRWRIKISTPFSREVSSAGFADELFEA